MRSTLLLLIFLMSPAGEAQTRVVSGWTSKYSVVAVLPVGACPAGNDCTAGERFASAELRARGLRVIDASAVGALAWDLERATDPRAVANASGFWLALAKKFDSPPIDLLIDARVLRTAIGGTGLNQQTSADVVVELRTPSGELVGSATDQRFGFSGVDTFLAIERAYKGALKSLLKGEPK